MARHEIPITQLYAGRQWGVQFADGSVAALWNGKTQRDRAIKYLFALRAETWGWRWQWHRQLGTPLSTEQQAYRLVSRAPDGPWVHETDLTRGGYVRPSRPVPDAATAASVSTTKEI